MAQPVDAPEGVFPQFGGLEITTSSTALQALTDAVLYLVDYPFECSEQFASRILAVAALRDVLTAFEADGLPSPEEMEAAVQRDIERLQGLQNDDGGFPYWRRGRNRSPSTPSMSPTPWSGRRTKGFSVPADMQPARAGLPAQHRKPLPRLVQPGDPPDAQRLRPLRARPAGRQRRGQGPETAARAEHR